MQELQFDYFRGGEAEQFSFYRVPKVLFTAECFRILSCEAKVLYGLMLDRMGLSIKNRWFDDENRVYIVFKVEEIMELLNCKSQKAIKLLKELDSENGIGLIEKRRPGLGKPNIIYVKNFLIREAAESGDGQETEMFLSEQEGETQRDMCGISQNFENQKSGVSKIKDQEFRKSKIKNFENQKSGVLKMEDREIRESKVQNFENQKSGSLKIEDHEIQELKVQNFENQKSEVLKIENPEFRKSKGNNTDLNDNEKKDTISSYLSLSDREAGCNQIDRMDTYRSIVKENIAYEVLVHDGMWRTQELDNIVELIVDVMMLPDEMPVRIGGSEKMAALIKSRFMKLTMMHITYVLNCLRSNTTKVGNIKSYILTALYNSIMTMDHYYQAEVNHDLHGIV